MRLAPLLACALAATTVALRVAAQPPNDAGTAAADAAMDGDASAPHDQDDEEDTDAAAAPPASASSGAKPPAAVTFGPLESFDLAQGIQVTVQAPSDWTATAGDVQIPDLDQVPGAQVKVSRSWAPAGKDRGGIFLVCVSAPSTDWTHGLESLVFERMNGIATKQLGRYMNVTSFQPGAVEETSFGFQQDFRASGQGGTALKQGGVRVLEPEDGTPRRAPRMSVMGRHTLTFTRTESDPAVLTCSLACVERARHAGAVCSTALGTHRIVGETGPEPTPTLRARFVVGFGRRPIALAGVAAGLLSLMVGVAAVVRGLLLPNRA